MDLYKIQSVDDRRDLIVPGDREQTLDFCAAAWAKIAADSIQKKGVFFVALSGGSTPNAIYHRLSELPYRKQVDWTKVLFFWSDERAVAADHPDSNYGAAMKAGLGQLPIPSENIFRMKTDPSISVETSALEYEELIRQLLGSSPFDLVMLGVGEDGHTASLFPDTEALHTPKGSLVAGNYVPFLKAWRMTLTYQCINAATYICIYALGKNKANIVLKALFGDYSPEIIPVQKIGSSSHKALWIIDHEACEEA